MANARRPEADLPAPPALGTTEAGVVLGALCALYAFVAAQLVGVSSGSRHILESQGLTYAEYAREGFFQLLWAAAITVVVLLCVRACTGRARGALLWLSEAIVVLTLGVVASALRRLQLYEAAYGLTMLRLACTVVAVGIGAVFVLVGVAMARRDAAASGRLAPAVLAVALVFVAGWSSPTRRRSSPSGTSTAPRTAGPRRGGHRRPRPRRGAGHRRAHRFPRRRHRRRAARRRVRRARCLGPRRRRPGHQCLAPGPPACSTATAPRADPGSGVQPAR
ncbi:MAG: DUF4173 domain-containing protein [Acidimicrobiales bacterium]